MNILEFMAKFAEMVDIDEVSALDVTTKFRDLDEWNSLAALSVISMFEEEFGKTLSVVDFRKAITIEDLYNLGNCSNA